MADWSVNEILGAWLAATLAVNGVSVVVPNVFVAIELPLSKAPLDVVEPLKSVFIDNLPFEEFISNTPLPLFKVQVTDWFAENAAIVPLLPFELI